jgi:endonuclease-8
MAEGPVVHHYAKRLRAVLEGKEVRIEFGLKKLKASEPSVSKTRILKVEAHGKQFRFHLEDQRILLIHLMMWGSWRIFKRGQAWDKPREQARVIFDTNSHTAVVFSAPVVRLLTPSELQENPSWGNLGPDPLRHDFSSTEFWRRFEQDPSREVGEVLLDQQVIAGVGNILRIEILFRSRIHPHRKVESLSAAEKQVLLYWILKLFEQWIRNMGKGSSWIQIYRKSKRPCPNCNTMIEFFRQAGRITYACPQCQQ